VLAALNAVSHEVIRVANHSYINATSVCALLRLIAAAELVRPITVVLDNARYQRCAVVQALARSLKIELLFLPTYSPNLNLIERLWRFVKKECLGAKPKATYEDFTAAIDGCLGSCQFCARWHAVPNGAGYRSPLSVRSCRDFEKSGKLAQLLG
jgi:transposase